MIDSAKLIITDSYFNIFNVLLERLNGTTGTLGGGNLIFCEEKISLMTERVIADRFGGSFNTDVYSLGNYLQKRMQVEKLLSKEGSSMVVKRVLQNAELKSFSLSRINLASTLYELLILLKSAKVTVEEVCRAAEESTGLLKNKLIDIAEVYSGYEKFINDGGYNDQSSILSFLPTVIEEDDRVKNSNVILLGFTTWTKQAKSGIEALMKNAKSVTAILVGGNNPFVYSGETIEAFTNLCKDNGVKIETTFVSSHFNSEALEFNKALFNPAYKGKTTNTDSVYVTVTDSVRQEIEIVAENIKQTVLNGGCRYKDFTIAVPDMLKYGDVIKTVFTELEIPYFLDAKRKVENHPLVRLVVSYIEVLRKNFMRENVIEFFKNPLITTDRALADELEIYLFENNVKFINKEQSFISANQRLKDYANSVLEIFSMPFSIKGLFERINVEQKIIELSKTLLDFGEIEESAINKQVYTAICSILDETELILGKTPLSLAEMKTVFLSGVSALEISIIPQYNDAVFIGDYKQTGLCVSNYLFMVGLTSEVPSTKEDVALLSDSDINKLEEIKVLIEPKIKVVNKREKEAFALSVTAFNKKLFLSYPSTDLSGKKSFKGEVILTAERLFNTKTLTRCGGYLTVKQGIKTFAEDCGNFVNGITNDIDNATAFYISKKGRKELDYVLLSSQRKIKVRLEGNQSVINKVISPTTIEEYYNCPYRAFLSKMLKLNERQTGEVDAPSAGTLFHDIFDKFSAKLAEIDSNEKFEKVFGQILLEVKESKYCKRFTLEVDTNAMVSRIFAEAKKCCHNIFMHTLNSQFKTLGSEVSFGFGGESLPAIELDGGNVKLRGKIDRVDTFNDYYRIIDYKTGKVSDADKNLFAGTKLQLYLYARAIRDMKLAGVYYLPLNDDYKAEKDKQPFTTVGKTVNDETLIYAQDATVGNEDSVPFIPVKVKDGKFTNVISSETLSAYVNYAMEVSNVAVKEMQEGVIVPSPAKDACKYCKYKGLCDMQCAERGIAKVDELVITKAVDGENNG